MMSFWLLPAQSFSLNFELLEMSCWKLLSNIVDYSTVSALAKICLTHKLYNTAM